MGFGSANSSYQLTKYDGEFTARAASGSFNTAYVDFNKSGTRGRLLWDVNFDAKITKKEKKPIGIFKIRKSTVDFFTSRNVSNPGGWGDLWEYDPSSGQASFAIPGKSEPLLIGGVNAGDEEIDVITRFKIKNLRFFKVSFLDKPTNSSGPKVKKGNFGFSVVGLG